ncbi:TetR/AcrR family transcriptional regulator [Bradyrhizobium genosp. P]|uniref:TetR/AcrR family transcriptional regulator n=1 Tax=Bradyrhizobium genosp. P TaxID=83641 RepID=UPI003CEB1F99
MGRPPAISNEQIIAEARRCFLARGANISAVEIARELGVSHTTLFNRFGSKEGLMVAALGISDEIPWVAGLETGPNDYSFVEQLTSHGKIIAEYSQSLHARMALLQAAGISHECAMPPQGASPAPVRAYLAFADWLRRAQDRGLIGDCGVETLASTILGALYSWTLTASACGHSTTAGARNDYVERFVELIWKGISPVDKQLGGDE